MREVPIEWSLYTVSGVSSIILTLGAPCTGAPSTDLLYTLFATTLFPPYHRVVQKLVQELKIIKNMPYNCIHTYGLKIT
jgi:hypothetical protein